MGIIDKYICYIRDIRRYSERTVEIYGRALRNYVHVIFGTEYMSEEDLVASMNPSELRQYEMHMLEKGISARTIGLHMSALSGFCRFLMNEGRLKSNPVRLVSRPKREKRLPEFYRNEAMESYFGKTADRMSRDEIAFFMENHNGESGKAQYEGILGRMIISILYCLGIRRAEIISLNVGNVDFGRKVVNVTGKGDKMRKIPLIASLCEEILLYLEAVEVMCGGKRSLTEPLLVTYSGKRLYPNYVDRTVKRELEGIEGMTGRKSPHVLRHSLATELMNEGTDINSIKELLGHSSLAATQVYTHSNISRLKTIYESAHPRAKNGGKHGD